MEAVRSIWLSGHNTHAQFFGKLSGCLRGTFCTKYQHKFKMKFLNMQANWKAGCFSTETRLRSILTSVGSEKTQDRGVGIHAGKVSGKLVDSDTRRQQRLRTAFIHDKWIDIKLRCPCLYERQREQLHDTAATSSPFFRGINQTPWSFLYPDAQPCVFSAHRSSRGTSGDGPTPSKNCFQFQ